MFSPDGRTHFTKKKNCITITTDKLSVINYDYREES